MIEVKRVEGWQTSDGMNFPAKAQAQAYEAERKIRDLIWQEVPKGTDTPRQIVLDFLTNNRNQVVSLLGYIIEWENISHNKDLVKPLSEAVSKGIGS